MSVGWFCLRAGVAHPALPEGRGAGSTRPRASALGQIPRRRSARPRHPGRGSRAGSRSIRPQNGEGLRADRAPCGQGLFRLPLRALPAAQRARRPSRGASDPFEGRDARALHGFRELAESVGGNRARAAHELRNRRVASSRNTLVASALDLLAGSCRATRLHPGEEALSRSRARATDSGWAPGLEARAEAPWSRAEGRSHSHETAAVSHRRRRAPPRGRGGLASKVSTSPARPRCSCNEGLDLPCETAVLSRQRAGVCR